MKHFYKIALLVIVLIGLQVTVTMTDRVYYLTQLTMAAYYTMAVLGLTLLMGYAGQISLGHAGFFAIGGYTSAVLTTFNLRPYSDSILFRLLDTLHLLQRREDLYGELIINVNPVIAMVLAIVISAVIAYVIGIPVLKLKGHYLAMATLGFGIIVYRIVLGTPVFGEADGISDVPPFFFFGNFGISGDMDLRIQNYYIAWAFVVLILFILMNLLDSRVGRALRAIHGAEDASKSVGVDTAEYKLKTFVLSAVIASMAGVCLTHFNGGIGPSEASVMKSIRYVSIVAAGGMASLWGTMFMSTFLNFMSLRGYFGSYDDAVFGGILILIMLFAPEGILSLSFRRWFSKLFSPAEDG
ncbi:MAG: branched-chain amino acid ABC transporter permease [Nitrospirae bacterium]|nr:branched-chain amino acid ABC transporter permease [Nitrospirota bacterium]